MKKIISLCLVILFSLFLLPVCANGEMLSPRYNYIMNIGEDFSINESTGKADVDADLVLETGAHCLITAEVKKEVNSRWEPFATFRKSGSKIAIMGESINLTQGYRYKCVFTFTAYDENYFVIEQEVITSAIIDYR